MDLAAVILSTISLCISIACIVLMLAKNFFSSHVIQREMVDPFKDLIGGEIGKPMMDPFKEIGDPISEEELEGLSTRKKKIK